jgi:hypothetical protein
MTQASHGLTDGVAFSRLSSVYSHARFGTASGKKKYFFSIFPIKCRIREDAKEVWGRNRWTTLDLNTYTVTYAE